MGANSKGKSKKVKAPALAGLLNNKADNFFLSKNSRNFIECYN